MNLKTLITSEFIYYREEPNIGTVTMWAEELKNYDVLEIQQAYKKLRNAHTKVPQPQFIKKMLLGFIDADEAWSLLPNSEEDSVVWNQAARKSWGSVRETMASDLIGARMAFKRAYDANVLDCLDVNERAIYELSEGSNKEMRDQRLKQAIDRGWIKPKHAREWSPDIALPQAQLLQIEGVKETYTESVAQENIEKLKSILSGKKL